MKKLTLLFLAIFSLLLSGCDVYYDNNIPDEKENNPSTPENPDDSSSTDDSSQEEPTPEEREPLVIDSNALFYPTYLNLESDLIKNYTYIDENKIDQYEIYSAYYSEYYDTLYIAYDDIASHSQTLKAKDLYEIEMHAINYFESDEMRSEDKNYLKAVRIYPDRLASSCRMNLSDEDANNINGCADYGGKEAIIDLNNTASLEDFYNEKREQISPTQYVRYEPMRDTFAHEYGHVSTFYHMAYKNDEDYEDYLKLRLQDSYDIIYPDGLPSSYSSDSRYYYTMPEEILADDFVELFYDTSSKKDNDTSDYTLKYTDLRNSLRNYSDIRYLKNNTSLYLTLKNYFKTNFLTNESKNSYKKPIVVTNSTRTINYYESYSKIGNTSNIKSISSTIDVNLIAVGEVIVNNIKYYRVILSNTFYCPNNRCNQKDAGKTMGYILANDYVQNNAIKIYSISNKIKKGYMATINKNVEDTNPPTISSLYLLPYYDFSYVLNTSTNENFAIMYDYLNTRVDNQQYKINIYSFGTLIN